LKERHVITHCLAIGRTPPDGLHVFPEHYIKETMREQQSIKQAALAIARPISVASLLHVTTTYVTRHEPGFFDRPAVEKIGDANQPG
jgi:hypothetical protein